MALLPDAARSLPLLIASLLLPGLAACAARPARPGPAPAPGAIPATMKAVRFHATGGPEVLVYEDAPVPVPGPGELLVRVHAAGVNPVDWKLRSGARPTALPGIPGFDVSGVVVASGGGTGRFHTGDAVFAHLAVPRGGGYAQYAVVRDEEACLRPASLDDVQAAAVPLASLTAWQALREAADLRPGQTVLIHGAAGGVGSFAVQIAKAMGATVIGTASAHNLAFLSALGADRTVDYGRERFEDLVQGVDVVLDLVGGETLERSYAVVRPGGILVTVAGQPSAEAARQRGIRAVAIRVRPDGADLARIAALIDAGKIRPAVSEVLPLAEARRAQEASQGRHTRGKLVLRVAE
jgi:NADPH:quinone reductase-like Zn-dependent oxidoreductase